MKLLATENPVNYPTSIILIDSIVATAPRRDVTADWVYEEILRDNTMRFPISVITQEVYQESLTSPKPFRSVSDEDNEYYCIVGNNRLPVAKELGYTHIECYVITELKNARRTLEDIKRNTLILSPLREN